MRYLLFCLLVWAAFCARPIEAEPGVAGDMELKGTLGDIPMHYVDLPNFQHAETVIRLDGLVDEPLWLAQPYFDNMIVAVPGTGKPGEYPTQIRFLTTERGIYVSAVMTQPPETLVGRLSNRDEFIDRDTIGVTLDTTGTGLFAYWFILALGDTKMDGKVLPERRYNNSWDGPWLGKSARLDDGWSAEMFFPWSMMNVPPRTGKRTVGFALSRQVSHSNERYQWPGHPYSSAQFVTALNDMRIEGVTPRQQYSFIPYSSQTFDRARDDNRTRVGADLTWRPSPSFEVTASVFPDFGAVEADDVVLNLTALEVFFPEKRLFFLEGNEVFESTRRSSSSNYLRQLTNENFATTARRKFITDSLPTPISIVNTRRIGGTASQISLDDGIMPRRGERNLPTDLLGAAKLTGSVGGLRYGILGAAEDDVKWQVTDTANTFADTQTIFRGDGRNFGVARFLYEGEAGDNRFSTGYIGTHVDGPLYDATVHGVDAHFSSASGRWNADAQFLRSDVDEVTGEGALVDIRFAPGSGLQHTLELDYFDANVNINDLGFLRRNDYAGAQYALQYADATRRRFVRGTRGAFALRQQYNVSEGQVVDSSIAWRNILTLPGRNVLRSAIAFQPARWEDRDSRGNGAYRTKDRLWWQLLWSTDASRMFSYSFGVGGLQEHLGDWTDQANAGITIRPTNNLSLDIDVTYKHRDGWLVYQGDRNFGAFHGADWQPSMKFNWFLTANHQLRLSLQWAGVRVEERGFYAVPEGGGRLTSAPRTLDNHDFTVSLLTTQLRYRWEIAPLTDLYLVYNRGNSLPNQIDADFVDLFTDAFNDPVIDSFVAKLRYRFGN